MLYQLAAQAHRPDHPGATALASLPLPGRAQPAFDAVPPPLHLADY